MKLLLIIGNGGHANSVIEVAKSLEKYKLCQVTYTDEGEIQFNTSQQSLLKTFSDIDIEYIIAVGSIDLRKRISESKLLQPWLAAKLVSPNAYISNNVKIAGGSIVMPGCFLRSGASLGKHSIVNTASILDHDVEIGNFVNISPNVTICGKVKIEDQVFLGASATVIENIFIKKNTVVGAGAIVIGDIRVSGLYKGIPARKD